MSTSTTTMNFADAVRMSEDPVQGVLRTQERMVTHL